MSTLMSPSLFSRSKNMSRPYPATSIDYSKQISANLDELHNRERINTNDVICHPYIRRILQQYQSFGLEPDTLLFCIFTALGSISRRSFIRRLDNIPILLNHGSVIVGRTGNQFNRSIWHGKIPRSQLNPSLLLIILGTNKTSYIKLIRHGVNTLEHHYQLAYRPSINKNAYQIDRDQNLAAPAQHSSTSTKMASVSFMTEVCNELAITKNLATTDTFLCHDGGDVILSTFGFYSPSD